MKGSYNSFDQNIFINCLQVGTWLEKEMATHSSIPAWRILWTEEPGGLPSVGSHRVGHDWSSSSRAPDGRADLLEKTLVFGKIESKRRRGQQRMRWLGSITNSMEMNLKKLWEIVEDRGTWHAAVHAVTESGTWLKDWTTSAPKCCDLRKARQLVWV